MDLCDLQHLMLCIELVMFSPAAVNEQILFAPISRFKQVFSTASWHMHASDMHMDTTKPRTLAARDKNNNKNKKTPIN